MSLKVDAGVHLAEFVSWAIRQSGTNTVNLVLQRYGSITPLMKSSTGIQSMQMRIQLWLVY